LGVLGVCRWPSVSMSWAVLGWPSSSGEASQPRLGGRCGQAGVNPIRRLPAASGASRSQSEGWSVAETRSLGSRQAPAADLASSRAWRRRPRSQGWTRGRRMGQGVASSSRSGGPRQDRGAAARNWRRFCRGSRCERPTASLRDRGQSPGARGRPISRGWSAASLPRRGSATVRRSGSGWPLWLTAPGTR